MGAPSPRLNRETFSTSRLLEFASEKELVAQTGHATEDWPLVIVKEATDNGLDTAEEIGVAPMIEIRVSTRRGEIVIQDNGRGIPTQTIEDIFDYTARVSSREAYVAPCRGQQGNALKCLIAMPFVLDHKIGETISIEAGGIAHRVSFSVDPIRQEPRISCDRNTSTVRNGTRFTVRWPEKACHLLEAASGRILSLVWDFVGLNPHLAITLDWNDNRLVDWNEPTDPAWHKWTPSDPIPAHWYSTDRLQRYIAACVNRDLEQGGRLRSVRDFLGGFRGLTSTTKRSAVLDATDLSRAPLGVFFDGDQVDRAGIAGLLAVMKQQTRPVKPETLGSIGEAHFRRVFSAADADQDRLKYCRVLGEDVGGLPFVAEAAFAPADKLSPTPIVSGINWSPSIRDPFRSLGGVYGQSLDAVLLTQHVVAKLSRVVAGVHLASPTVQFIDRGKSAAMVGVASGNAIADAVRKVTKAWSADWDAQQRARYRDKRTIDKENAAQAQKERKRQQEVAREQEASLAAGRDAEKETKRQRSATVGSGVLYAEIAAAAAEAGVQITDLLVLSKNADPYFRDTEEGHENGRWFADQVDRFVDPYENIHLRGSFYRIVVPGDVKRPDGSPFINDYDNWPWLQNKAAKAARWLGYVQFERIRDERNEAPRTIAYADSPAIGRGYLSPGIDLELPKNFSSLLPYLAMVRPVVQQPYRIIMIGEKSSLGEVLAPIASEVKGTLLLPTGEASDTMIATMARRAIGDARRAVVLYFADFDPSGHQMSHSVSRKLQALRRLRHPNLRIEVHQVALTRDQVRRLGLPSTPLKSTEKRAEKWRKKMGHEQTEIDALAALRPGELAQIAREALAPFFDFTLSDRCDQAFQKARKEAYRQLDQHPAWPVIKESIREAYDQLKAAAVLLADVQTKAVTKLREGEHGVRSFEIPAPEVKITAVAPSPLFTTDDDFITATRKLIASRALDDDGNYER